MRATIPLTEDGMAEAQRAADLLPPRWRPQRWHAGQASAFHSKARFRAIECGRRSGKSEGRKRELVIRALDPDWPLRDRYIVVGAPTQQQTMRLYWRDLHRLIPKQFVAEVRKSDYEIELTNGALIRCLGMDRPERAEGDPLDDLFLDEAADMRLEEVLDHLRPSLDTPDRPPGTLTGYGTTDMRSGKAFIDICDQWRAEQAAGNPDYSHHHWTSRGIVTDKAWDEAKRTMEPSVFAVEYEARRVSTGNLCYYGFDRNLHVVHGLRLDVHRPLIVCCDWNWDPATAVIAQEQTPIEYLGEQVDLPANANTTFTAAIGEVFIRQSNTVEAMRAVYQWILDHGHRGEVRVYGDASGGSHRSSSVTGTDVDLVQKTLGPLLGPRLSTRFASSNPSIKSRVNAMNSRFRMGEHVAMLVSPECRELIHDFELVCWKDGAAYEIAKATDKQGKLRSHLSDGLGYYIAAEHPVDGASFVDEVW